MHTCTCTSWQVTFLTFSPTWEIHYVSKKTSHKRAVQRVPVQKNGAQTGRGGGGERGGKQGENGEGGGENGAKTGHSISTRSIAPSNRCVYQDGNASDFQRPALLFQDLEDYNKQKD